MLKALCGKRRSGDGRIYLIKDRRTSAAYFAYVNRVMIDHGNGSFEQAPSPSDAVP